MLKEEIIATAEAAEMAPETLALVTAVDVETVTVEE